MIMMVRSKYGMIPSKVSSLHTVKNRSEHPVKEKFKGR